MTATDLSFEQGPIRPPNEARSLLLRFTRNCPWNQCRFCPVYKKRRFSLRQRDEIEADIRAARAVADEITALSRRMGFDGQVSDRVAQAVLSGGYNDCFRHMALWLYYRTGACFLQDADNLVMTKDDLVAALTLLRQQFPEINRVTTYARSRTIVKKSDDTLKSIADAGLDRIHIGLETGYDPLLKLMKKGVSADQHVKAGKRVKAAGMQLSEYVMPGLGGKAMWAEHARATARVLNRINPDFIRLRSLRVPRRVPLRASLDDGSFAMLSDDELAAEIKLFIEHLDGIDSQVTSDHIMNLLPEVSGRLPDDKARMIEAVDRYLALSDQDRLIYRVGRRGGTYQSIDDLSRDPATYAKIKSLIDSVAAEDGADGVERFVTEMVDRYI